MSLSTAIRLRVAFGPTQAVIEGHRTVKIGDSLTLTCSSQGSVNPAPLIKWSINGKEIEENITTEYVEPLGRGIRQSLTLVSLTAQHNGKVVQCEVINKIANISRVDQVTLDVQYGPDNLSLTGPSNLSQNK